MMDKRMRLSFNFERGALQKHHSKENSSEDHISNLADENLLTILSFLTLKEAAVTSLLSRRWVDMWKFVARLNFDATGALIRIAGNRGLIKMERVKYVDWVNQVLHEHKAPVLEEFRVCFNLDKSNGNDFDEWLRFALARKVQRLELDLLGWGDHNDYFRRYCVPSELRAVHSSNSSTRPQLNRCILLSHTSSNFRPLKALCLKRVNVTDEILEFFLSRCPMLEELIVHGSGELVNIEVSGPSLKLNSLEIYDCQNLKSIKVYNTNLSSFRFRGDIKGVLLENLPFLTEVLIGKFALLSDVFGPVSSCCYSLEVLTLESELFDVAFDLDVLPKLPKLKQLVVNLEIFEHRSIWEFASLVNMSPFLEKFTFQLKWQMPLMVHAEVEEPPICPHYYLRVVEFTGYCGRPCDETVVMYFLKNALALEELVIDPWDRFRIDPQHTKLESDITMTTESRALAKEQLEGKVPSHIRFRIL